VQQRNRRRPFGEPICSAADRRVLCVRFRISTRSIFVDHESTELILSFANALIVTRSPYVTSIHRDAGERATSRSSRLAGVAISGSERLSARTSNASRSRADRTRGKITRDRHRAATAARSVLNQPTTLRAADELVVLQQPRIVRSKSRAFAESCMTPMLPRRATRPEARDATRPEEIVAESLCERNRG